MDQPVAMKTVPRRCIIDRSTYGATEKPVGFRFKVLWNICPECHNPRSNCIRSERVERFMKRRTA